jgi:hypothetical protein
VGCGSSGIKTARGPIVRLWQAYNHHLLAVMATADVDALLRPRARHNLDQLAWKTVSASAPVTRDFFMRDYVGHLKHHLRQTQ